MTFTHTQRTAVAAALPAYERAYDRLRSETEDPRTLIYLARVYERGSRALRTLAASASDLSLSADASEAAETYVRALQSDDPEELEFWLGLLPERVGDAVRDAIPVVVGWARHVDEALRALEGFGGGWTITRHERTYPVVSGDFVTTALAVESKVYTSTKLTFGRVAASGHHSFHDFIVDRGLAWAVSEHTTLDSLLTGADHEAAGPSPAERPERRRALSAAAA